MTRCVPPAPPGKLAITADTGQIQGLCACKGLQSLATCQHYFATQATTVELVT